MNLILIDLAHESLFRFKNGAARQPENKNYWVTETLVSDAEKRP
jgi:hypothetical protein